MSDPQLATHIAAARAYEALFVPALFQPWAPVVAAAAMLQTGDHVLDVACGTGVLAREASTRVGASGHVAGVDVAPGMLTVARDVAPAIEWEEGSADALPFPDEAFDTVVSQFGLMFFPDRVAALREMMRVLVSGGFLAVAVWGALDSMPAFADEVALLERLAGRAAADALRAPFALGDPRSLLEFAREAGVDDIDITTETRVARFPAIRALVEADLRGWLPVVGVPLDEATIAAVLAEADTSIRHRKDAQGRAEFDMSAHILTGAKV